MKKLIFFLALFIFIPLVKADTVNFRAVGKIWDGSTIVETYDNYPYGSTSNYKGFINLSGGNMFKLYFFGQIWYWEETVFKQAFAKDWFYTLNVCSQIPVPNDYSIANSGDGLVTQIYNTQSTGTTCTLGSNVYGKLYKIPFVIHYNTFEIDAESTERVSDVLVDFEFGNYYGSTGKIAITSITYEEYTEELANSISELNQSNTLINQNSTIINQNQDIINKQQETNSKLDGIDNSINNSNVENPSSKFEEFENMLPENGVITELITLPISLFQNVLGSINGTCTEYNLGNLLGTELKLPCINISNYIGSTLWNVIDILFSGFFVLVIGKKMIKAFNGFTSMEEGDVLD